MQQALFPDFLPHQEIIARFDTASLSSNGGYPLLQACDEYLDLTASLASCLCDPRSPKRVRHSLVDLIRQRVFGIVLGYEDCNDAARLRSDPALKLSLRRAPLAGPDLASQPTLSRFENSPTPRDLLRLSVGLAESVLANLKRRHPAARCITIDCDPTCDPTHGSQQLSLFNGFYNTACYLPLVTTLQIDRDPEHYLVSVVLRPGNSPAPAGLRGVLKRLLPQLRRRFPRARLRIRLDAGFQGGQLLAWLREQRVEVVLGLATNPVLQRHAEPLAERMRARYADWRERQGAYQQALAERARAQRAGEALGPAPQAPKRPKPLYGQVQYRARSWSQAWRVVIKVDMALFAGREPKLNQRFVLTDVRGAPRRIYERIYCPRGDAENRLKELKQGLAMDRTSCQRFAANQFRVLLTAAAYALLQELRWQARGTPYERAQVQRLRLHLLKLGARVEQSARAVILHLPRTAPAMGAWLAIAAKLGAAVPPT